MSTQLPDDLRALESELSDLRPCQPSFACEAKIEARLEPGPRTTSLSEWRPLAQAAAVVLTALCLTFWIEGGRTKPLEVAAGNPVPVETARTEPALPQPNAALRLLRPVSSTQVLLSAEPEGMVQLPDGSLARRIRARSVHQLEFSEGDGAQLVSYSIPREDIVLVPVRAY